VLKAVRPLATGCTHAGYAMYARRNAQLFPTAAAASAHGTFLPAVKLLLVKHRPQALIVGLPLDPQGSSDNEECRRAHRLVDALQSVQVRCCCLPSPYLPTSHSLLSRCRSFCPLSCGTNAALLHELDRL